MQELDISRHLKTALSLVSHFNRPEPLEVVDTAQVIRDTNEVHFVLRNCFADPHDLLRIFLQRSDPHIQRLSTMFNSQTGKELDNVIRTHAWLDKDIKKIVVHAIRTAVNMTYRDVMLLRDVLGANSPFRIGSSEKLGIRVVRLHWYPHHWQQVRAAYNSLTGKEFRHVMERETRIEMEFGGMMAALASI